ncbi:MAG: hypothetical protein ACOH2B_05335 [Burkholderiaceae bacterium]
MPILYHYTCRNNIEGIFHKGFICPGNAVVNSEEIRSNYAVCLTSDKNPIGHGLPDGREISHEQAANLKSFSKSDGRIFSLDFTKYRIKINVPDNDENLIYVPIFMSTRPDILKAMEIAGHYPCIDFNDINSTLTCCPLFEERGIKGKSHTWWYYRGCIPSNWFVEVGIKMSNDLYLSVAPGTFQEQLVELSRKQ